jgi:two-component SAPR family response regulator
MRGAEPIVFTGKTQRKPLDLLKLTIALGGRNVDTELLISSLWPDAEGDDGHRAFGVALFRLRKLLAREDTLLLQDGKLSLDPLLCWVDAWAFERLTERVETALRESTINGTALALDELSDRMLNLYHGHFLASESDFWVLAPRERLRSKFLRHGSAIGKRLETAGQWELASRLYERVLELDPLAEEFYRGLMICHRARGNQAEAVVVYRRCRDMLSVVLGVLPSAETQAVFETLNRLL